MSAASLLRFTDIPTSVELHRASHENKEIHGGIVAAAAEVERLLLIAGVVLLAVHSACTILFVATVPVPVSWQSTAQSRMSAGVVTLGVGGTLVSPGGVFEVGFASSSRVASAANASTAGTDCALANWFAQPAPHKNQKSVVWVADRAMALISQASLTLSVQCPTSVSVGRSSLCGLHLLQL